MSTPLIGAILALLAMAFLKETALLLLFLAAAAIAGLALWLVALLWAAIGTAPFFALLASVFAAKEAWDYYCFKRSIK
jgi:hypothetical protein